MASQRKRRKTKQSQEKATSIGSLIEISRRDDVWRLSIPIDPVPASRPRFTRSGHTFYGKNYTTFRKQAAVLFGWAVLPPEFPLCGQLAVTTRFIVAKPKTSKLSAPRGDVDNYFKTLDVLNEVVWKDDVQLLWASMSKEFGEKPRIEMEVTEIGGLEVLKARSLSEMR